MTYADYEWFLEHDLSDYAGKWIAIIEKKVIAANRNVNKLITQVKNAHPNKRPLVTKINNKLSILY